MTEPTRTDITRLIRRIVAAAAVTFALAATSAAQDNPRALGDSLRMAGDLEGALRAYLETYRNNDSAENAYAVASTFALHGQFPDSAFHYLDAALEDETSMRPLHDADLYFLTDLERWEDVEARMLDKLAAQLGESFHREYARELLRIRLKEWGYRYHIMLGYRQLGPKSPLLSALGKAMEENHEENQADLKPLLERHGWPELSAVGEEAAYAAGNVINHSDLATRQKYLPLLRAACEKGEADWSRYAHIFDRTELELGNPQVYGTQMELDEQSGRYEPRPMVKPEQVDQRRAAKGMEPIAAQLERFNKSMERDFGSSDE